MMSSTFDPEHPVLTPVSWSPLQKDYFDVLFLKKSALMMVSKMKCCYGFRNEMMTAMWTCTALDLMMTTVRARNDLDSWCSY